MNLDWSLSKIDITFQCQVRKFMHNFTFGIYISLGWNSLAPALRNWEFKSLSGLCSPSNLLCLRSIFSSRQHHSSPGSSCCRPRHFPCCFLLPHRPPPPIQSPIRNSAHFISKHFSTSNPLFHIITVLVEFLIIPQIASVPSHPSGLSASWPDPRSHLPPSCSKKLWNKKAWQRLCVASLG